MAVELQAAVLFAMQQGYVDAIPVDRVKEFQTRLQEFLTTRKTELLAKILAKGAFDKELEAETKTALDEFKNLFK
jgi:F-type H+-transporting ATPase subunit alpha